MSPKNLITLDSNLTRWNLEDALKVQKTQTYNHGAARELIHQELEKGYTAIEKTLKTLENLRPLKPYWATVKYVGNFPALNPKNLEVVFDLELTTKDSATLEPLSLKEIPRPTFKGLIYPQDDGTYLMVCRTQAQIIRVDSQNSWPTISQMLIRVHLTKGDSK